MATVCAVEIYKKTGRIPCRKCGLDLLERESSTPICNEFKCEGIVISQETLKTWIKEKDNE